MAEEMSLLSQAEFDKIVNGDMSAEEAFSMLAANFLYVDFPKP